MRGFSATVVYVLLLMIFVQRNDCCCNVDTGTGISVMTINGNSLTPLLVIILYI